MTLSTTGHHPYHHGDLPNALLAAVGEIVAEKGAGNVSLREAARRAGVSHSAPAHHFGDKDGMLVAFAHQGFELLGSQMQAAFDELGDVGPEERINVAGDAYVRFADANRAHFDVMFRTGVVALESASHDEIEHHGPMALLDELVGEMADAGRVTRSEMQALAVCLWSSAHGLACLWVDGAIRDMFPEMKLDDLLDTAFGGGQIAMNVVAAPTEPPTAT